MERILYMTEIAKKKMIICSMAILIVCLWATVSFASWSAGFSENGIYGGTTYSITKIEVFQLNGTSSMEGSGMSNFSGGSWTVTKTNANYVVATNSTSGGTSSYSWLFSFSGTTSNSLNLVYLVYTSDGKVFGSYINYNYGSSSWSIPEITNVNKDDPAYNRTASSVPVPPAVFLFSGGLFSLVALRKKIKA